MSPWIFECHPLTTPPENAYGFIYIITNDQTGKRYIGSKHFYSYRTVKLPHRTTRKHLPRKESDWQTYFGSCGALMEDVNALGYDSFTREIVMLCRTEFELTYQEAKLQFAHDVLMRPDEYYNKNILLAVFTPQHQRLRKS